MCGAWCDVEWCSVCGVVCCVCCGVVWCGVVWCGVVWCGVGSPGNPVVSRNAGAPGAAISTRTLQVQVVGGANLLVKERGRYNIFLKFLGF